MKEIEEVKTFYQDEERLKVQPFTVYRLYVNGGRTYYTVDENNEPTFYISLTTLTKNTLPTSEHLIKWMCQLGYEEAKRYAKERANYGTLLHLAIGDFLINKKWDFMETQSYISEQIKQGKINELNVEYAELDLNSDIAAFAQFVVEYQVKPIAIELVLVSKKNGYGTLIDLVCDMVISEKGFFGEIYKSGERKGEPKETKRDKNIVGLINFKSGRKGFYEEHEIQLELEKMLFEENYPDVKIDNIYNWSPTEWEKTPTYKLKDQSDSLDKEKALALLQIAKIELTKRIPNTIVPTGIVEFGQPAAIKTESAVEMIKRKHEEVKLA